MDFEKFTSSDKAYKNNRDELRSAIGVPNLHEIVDQFPLYSGVQTLGKFLAIYEVMKRAIQVPGHIAEFGCWKGANLMAMTKILQLLQPNTYRYVFGFDGFEGLQTFSVEDALSESHKHQGEYRGNRQVLEKVISTFGFDDHVKLVVGNALDTVPTFEKENPHILLSLAYIDFDLYKPTAVALEFVHRRLSPGGLIVFDEALLNTWKGEGQAMAEFLNKYAGQYQSEVVPFARQPTAILIKK